MHLLRDHIFEFIETLDPTEDSLDAVLEAADAHFAGMRELRFPRTAVEQWAGRPLQDNDIDALRAALTLPFSDLPKLVAFLTAK